MYAEINGNSLYYETLGNPSNPAILCFHGGPGMGSHKEPKSSWGRLSDANFVVVQDQRGSGSSGLNPPFTHQQWVADADALRQLLNLGKVIVAGGSYGGYLSQEYVLAYPQNVRAVMLRDTAPDHTHDDVAEANALASPRVNKKLDYAKFRRIFDGKCLSDEDMRDCYAEIQPLYNVNWDPSKDHEKLMAIQWHHAAHNFAFSHNMPNFNLKPRLHEISVPVLITHGKQDWIIPLSQAEIMARLIPNSELVVFENSGHSPQVEEVELWEQTIRSFLKKHGL